MIKFTTNFIIFKQNSEKFIFFGLIAEIGHHFLRPFKNLFSAIFFRPSNFWPTVIKSLKSKPKLVLWVKDKIHQLLRPRDRRLFCFFGFSVSQNIYKTNFRVFKMSFFIKIQKKTKLSGICHNLCTSNCTN